MISCGQTLVHFWQAMHLDSSTSATPYSLREIAPNLHASTQAPQPIQPSLHPASPLTALHPPLQETMAALYGNFFLTAISTLPFVWCAHKRETVSADSVIAEICICDRRCGRDRCDLSDTDRSAGYFESRFIYNDRFDLWNFMGTE